MRARKQGIGGSQHNVAVSRLLRDVLRADIAVRTGTVFDNDRLPELHG